MKKKKLNLDLEIRSLSQKVYGGGEHPMLPPDLQAQLHEALLENYIAGLPLVSGCGGHDIPGEPPIITAMCEVGRNYRCVECNNPHNGTDDPPPPP